MKRPTETVFKSMKIPQEENLLLSGCSHGRKTFRKQTMMFKLLIPE